ncbi:hypothetical protein KUH03_06720 [Sphingobacterium sp. E70]|uniref:hypothetical protein n=1 Tax=Sphingobacterium sp. E70 TaxID=2853439 RepID=UPI00211BB8A3|nr:hypothetical protein [Sphingobacterium sp. E70]ULT26545.1 hypothetical protein KUH03_06720 [Sphingobacterium sp. E70]
MKNSGFEFSLGADIFRKDNFSWKVDANLSTLKNEITYLPGGALTFNNRGAGYRLEEGHSLYDFYMVKNAGVNPDNGNMQYWVKDDKGAGKFPKTMLVRSHLMIISGSVRHCQKYMVH